MKKKAKIRRVGRKTIMPLMKAIAIMFGSKIVGDVVSKKTNKPTYGALADGGTCLALGKILHSPLSFGAGLKTMLNYGVTLAKMKSLQPTTKGPQNWTAIPDFNPNTLDQLGGYGDYDEQRQIAGYSQYNQDRAIQGPLELEVQENEFEPENF